MLVARFASAEALRGWEDSSERAEWLRRAEPLTEGAPAHHRLSGIEGWFALPGRVVSAPKRWKTAVVTFPLICPVVLAVTGLVGGQLARLPLPLRAAAVPLVAVPLVTWAFLPVIARVARGWLLS
ncbi:MAG: hypothetical protein WCB85_13300 [Candidatus Dormiibacterota bacterium]